MKQGPGPDATYNCKILAKDLELSEIVPIFAISIYYNYETSY